MSYAFALVTVSSIYIILALSLNLVVGYGGLLTLAHAAYFAIGAYSYALVSQSLGFLGAGCVAMVVAALLSLMVSVPAWRFRGDDFVMVSLAVQCLIFSLLNNWYDSDAQLGTWANLTNGPQGISGLPSPEIAGLSLRSAWSVAALAVVCAGAVIYTARVWRGSPWCRLLIAVRDDELAARNLGKGVRRTKVEVMAISCALAALAGVIYAAHIGYVDPSLGSLDQSILLLCMVMVGGTGNTWGPFVGALVLVVSPELLRGLRVPGPSLGHVQLLAYGLLLVGLMHVRPQGLAGTFRIE